MSKLAELSKETQKLFRMVADDVGIDADAGQWVAVDFYNQGIGFDAEFQVAEVDHQQAASYNRLIGQISEADANWRSSAVKPETLVQTARVAQLATSGETVRLGIIEESAPIQWRPLAKDRAAAILDYFESWVEYRGMLQGIIHSLHKESAPPYFSLRDLASRALVRCVYEQKDYAQVYRSLERKDAVVLVSGWMKAKRIDRSVDYMRVERIEPTKPVNADKLREFFGSAPGWTGDLTTDQFIENVRRDTDDDE